MLRKTVSKKNRAPRERWTLRPERGERVIMRWSGKPHDHLVEYHIGQDQLAGPEVRRGFVLCYDGKPVHTWDAEVVYE